jgi:4-alpha-glucanotransferase
MRRGGILLPIFSLPGNYGIGCFSSEARRFIDFLKRAGQTYWQILPLGPTGYGDSPYQSFSTFAGNPYFIDLERLIEKGYLKKEEADEAEMSDGSNISYALIYKNRIKLLRTAFDRAYEKEYEDLFEFAKDNSIWLDDYAMFMAIKNHFDDVSFTLWPDDIRMREKDAMDSYREMLSDDIVFYIWLQYEFYHEWNELKEYANENGIRIIGDLPIYVSPDGADVWSHPELFQLDENRRPTRVAGCPPDGFSPDGQLWGNPLYNWEYHEETGFEWWKKRIAAASNLFDVIRIDHFRGLDEYYSIPADADTAVSGEWFEGPGMKLIRSISPVLEEKGSGIICEDLGFITDTVKQLVADSGYPNMKVLEFAFDSRDTGNSSDYMPYGYPKNCVAYTGTHDNETLYGWLEGLDDETIKRVRIFADAKESDLAALTQRLVRITVASPADTAIIPMQDYLGLDNSARINRPSTLGGNWIWRVSSADLTDELADSIREMTVSYGRLNQKNIDII